MSFLADSSRGRLLSRHCLNRVLSMLSSTKDGRVRFGRYKPIYLSPDKIDYVCDWERRQTKHEAPPRLHPRSLPHSCASSSPPQFASSAPSFLRKRVTYRVNEAKRAREEEGEVRAKSGRGEPGETRVRYGMDRRPRRHPGTQPVTLFYAASASAPALAAPRALER